MNDNHENDVVIVSAVRTPFGRFGGKLKEVHSIDLAVFVIREALQRVDLNEKAIDELYYGMCILSEAALESNVNARQALLRAGLPAELISLSIDRACCSSIAAVQLGVRAIRSGDVKSVMAVGTENMSNTPLLINGHRWGTGLKPPLLKDHLNPIFYRNYEPLAKDAGELALEYGIGRDEQDKWALQSQQRYQSAKIRGIFKDEVMAIAIPQKKGKAIQMEEDEFPRPETTLSDLQKLPTVYNSPSVTAGNAPGLDAGAAALIIMKKLRAEELGLKPLARVLSVQSIAMEPRRMAEAPAYAIMKALQKTNLLLSDIKLIEINEAFAAVPLVSTKILANNDPEKWEYLKSITNVNGGAIAVGHPVGASGARIMMTLLYELKRRGGGLGILGICGGLAQADSAIIQV
jgi:acetyl-CoA C-acetyltransferase